MQAQAEKAVGLPGEVWVTALSGPPVQDANSSGLCAGGVEPRPPRLYLSAPPTPSHPPKPRTVHRGLYRNPQP